MRLLLDTNVLIDLYTRRPPAGDVAQKLVALQLFGDGELWASAKSFTDVFYVLSGDYPNERIYEAFEASFAYMNLCAVDGNDVKRACALHWRDFEDCLVGICAQKVKADCIVTRDKTGFAESPIPAVSPQRLFECLKSDHGIAYDEIDF